jgi:hypothetical protein
LNSSPTPVAPLNALLVNRAGGSIGSSARCSATTKQAPTATATASRPSTSGERQPSVEVMVSAAVNATREAMASSWPGRSGRVAAWRGISAVRAATRRTAVAP